MVAVVLPVVVGVVVAVPDVADVADVVAVPDVVAASDVAGEVVSGLFAGSLLGGATAGTSSFASGGTV